jgi:hypothetical protein
MTQARKSGRWRPAAKTFADCLRDFLTPALWKQAQQVCPSRRSSTRWTTQALILTAVLMTWCYGDSQSERFAIARVFYVAQHDKRRRPGRTVQGFQKALARLPMAALRCVAAGVRQRLAALVELADPGGFVVMGCDGTRIECPRTEELEGRLRQAGKTDSAPTIWVTALVHLRTGLLWSWRIGKGTASERDHLRRLLTTLMKPALLVADAGYNGYELAKEILNHGASFLIRMSSCVSFYTAIGEGGEQVRNCIRDRIVYYYPRQAEQQGKPPLRVRLIRLRGKKGEVWLLTNVLDRQQLSVAMASRYYRWRWENEGLFRTYKRTLSKMKLMSRTVRLVHREAESSLLATQLLLAQGTLRRRSGERSSPRRLLLAIRAELMGHKGPHSAATYRRRLESAGRERRVRTTSKVKRRWPRRTDHQPPKPPKILTLSSKQKAIICRLEREET